MEFNGEFLCSIIPATSASSTRIVEDLLLEILKRLPVKSLCQFQSVCKYWKSLISSSSFTKLHLSFNSTTPAHLKAYLRREDFRRRCHNDYALCHPQDNHLRRPLFFPFRFRFDEGPGSYYNRFNFVDLIHGVVCLSYSVESRFDSNLLWNPASHNYIAVPLLPFPSLANGEFDFLDFECQGDSYGNAIGFGNDASKNDFKLVRIWMADDPPEDEFRSLPLVYEVYSARQGLLSVAIADNIKFCQISSYCTLQGRFVNGSIHWVVETYDFRSDFVLIFDCELEEFTTLELPQPVLGEDVTNMELLDYGGMLSVLANFDYGNIELWVMEEYGVTTTWKKLYEISRDTELNSNAVDINKSSHQFQSHKLAPYGPNEWIKFLWNDALFDDILWNNVYDESILLMNDTEAHSYTNEEIVHIDVSRPFYPWSEFSD